MKNTKKKKRIGQTQEKILLLLLTGVVLGLSRSPRKYFKIIGEFKKAWKGINEDNLKRSIKDLYESNLISISSEEDGTVKMILSKNGKELALKYNINQMKIPKPLEWDLKWRLVIFDIPEPLFRVRNSLRFHLKKLGFIELQKSVFVYPYPCLNEIEFIIETYGVRKYVRTLVVESIDNELDLKNKFNL
ncbi:MAG: hypothetical protein WCT19_02770 [Candidatus Paceibacterota bacterium]